MTAVIGTSFLPIKGSFVLYFRASCVDYKNHQWQKVDVFWFVGNYRFLQSDTWSSYSDVLQLMCIKCFCTSVWYTVQCGKLFFWKNTARSHMLGYTSFPIIYEPPPCSWLMKQVTHWGPTNIWRHCTRFSRRGNQVPGIWAPLPLCLIYLGIRWRRSVSSTDLLIFEKGPLGTHCIRGWITPSFVLQVALSIEPWSSACVLGNILTTRYCRPTDIGAHCMDIATTDTDWGVCS
jgi:hypothetical protein